MNYYIILMKGRRDCSDEEHTLYPVDEFKNVIVFSTSCIFESKVWFKCKCYNAFRNLKINDC